jgi:hypothetical protein
MAPAKTMRFLVCLFAIAALFVVAFGAPVLDGDDSDVVVRSAAGEDVHQLEKRHEYTVSCKTLVSLKTASDE